MAKFSQSQGTISRSNTQAPRNSDPAHCRNLLQKMGNNWHRHAQVKQGLEEQFDPELMFDAAKDDFRVDLLPFKDHPDFLQAPIEMQKLALSCGWIAYNEKTIDIESKVIAPACNHIVYGDLNEFDDGSVQQIASETLVDEAYHVLLVVNACRVTRKHRNLQSLKLPQFNLVSKMQEEQAKCSEPWQKIVVQLATAIVSEVFISDYLNLLSKDTTIQPFNRIVVATHQRDELAHSSIFKNLAKYLYSQLTAEQKDFFVDVLPKPVNWFANVELNVWQAMLEQINFPNAKSIIADCAAVNEVNLMRVDYSELIELAQEVGVLDSQRGRDSFAQAGLFN